MVGELRRSSGTSSAALPYETVHASARATRFIEDGGVVPRDGLQVDSTWRFVRRDGGPDLRFNNNAQLPIMRYGEVELSAGSGLRVVVQTSTVEAPEGMVRALAALAGQAAVSQHPQPPVPQVEHVRPAVPPARKPDQPAASPPDPKSALAVGVATLLRYLAAGQPMARQ